MNLSQFYNVLKRLALLHEQNGASEKAEALRSFGKAVATSRPRNLNDLIGKLERIEKLDGEGGSVRNAHTDSLK